MTHWFERALELGGGNWEKERLCKEEDPYHVSKFENFLNSKGNHMSFHEIVQKREFTSMHLVNASGKGEDICKPNSNIMQQNSNIVFPSCLANSGRAINCTSGRGKFGEQAAYTVLHMDSAKNNMLDVKDFMQGSPILCS
eukprot:181747-Pelagomonas_calceolata.AAC.1